MKRFTILLLICLIGFFDACKNPIDDFTLGFREPLPTLVTLQFRTNEGAFPDKVAIKVAGPDADKIVNVLNTTNFRVGLDGVLQLATVGSVTPSASRPLRFTIVANGDGFLEAVQPVELTSTSARTVSVALLRKSAAQTTSSVVQATAQSTSDGTVSQAVTVQNQTLSAATPQLTVNIPSGTQLKDNSGKTVGGELKVTVETLSALTANSAPTQQKLPNQGVITLANGQSARLTSVAGAFRMDIYNADYQNVRTFSQPVKVAFELNANTFNPVQKRPIKAGDAIPFFSQNEATGLWSEESAGTVTTDARGNLLYEAKLSHLSTYAAGFTQATCNVQNRLVARTSAGGYPYTCSVYLYRLETDATGKTTTNQQLATSRSIKNGDAIGLDYPAGQYRVEVVKTPASDDPSYPKNQVVSKDFTIGCDKNSDIDLDLTSFTKPAVIPNPVAVTIKFNCPNPDLSKFPETVTAFYRPAGQGDYAPLMTFSKSKIKNGRVTESTYALEIGKRYDLKIGVLGYNLDQTNYLVDKNEWPFTIKLSELCQ